MVIYIKSECLEFNGIKFRRYPNSKNLAHRSYYRPNSTHARNGIGALHQEIWKAKYGTIPEGFHIHHIDMNTLNNTLENLTCIPEKEHLRLHDIEWLKRPGNKEKRLTHMAMIREKATEWHRSEAGREWHSAHAKEGWVKIVPKTLKCIECGEEFESPFKNTLYCSDKCGERYRWRTQKDKTIECTVCGRVIQINKKSKRKTCSRECQTKSTLEAKRMNAMRLQVL